MLKYASCLNVQKKRSKSPQTTSADKCKQKAGTGEEVKMLTGVEDYGDLHSSEKCTKAVLPKQSPYSCCCNGLHCNGSTCQKWKSIASAFCSWAAALNCCA